MIHPFARSVLMTAVLLGAGGAHADYVGGLGTISAPSSVGFTLQTPSLSLHTGTPLAAPFNFLDQWSFTLANDASVSSLVAAFKFDDGAGGLETFGVENIQVNLLNGLSTVVVGWQSVTPGFPYSTSVSITPTAGLVGGGNYTLQVRGTLLGDPGAYSGLLIAAAPTAVPLPAVLPMLVLGLGALGATGARRRKSVRSA